MKTTASGEANGPTGCCAPSVDSRPAPQQSSRLEQATASEPSGVERRDVGTSPLTTSLTPTMTDQAPSSPPPELSEQEQKELDKQNALREKEEQEGQFNFRFTALFAVGAGQDS
jgi:hypothetical protein